jgi:outer membrane protein assembly factor BamB
MAIGSDGTIYVPLHGTKKLQALNPDGTKKWHYEFPEASGIPSIGSDGTIYAATASIEGLHALTSSGELKWTAGQCLAPDVAIASDGTIYFCGYDPASGQRQDNYIAVNPDGSTKWTLSIPAEVGSPAIGSDGTIYVTGGCHPGVLTAVYGSAPLASSPWPRSRHDNRNTGSYGVIPTPTFTPAPTPAPTPTLMPTKM